MGDSLITPLMQSVQDDMIKLRELRRLVEKSMDKYDNFHVKLGNNSNRNYRGPYEIKNDNVQLEELRKIYSRNLQEYLYRLNRFIVMIDNVMVEKVIFAITDMIEFSSSVDEFYQNIKPFMNDLKNELTTWQKDAQLMLEKKNIAPAIAENSFVSTSSSQSFSGTSLNVANGLSSNATGISPSKSVNSGNINRVPYEKSAYVFRKKLKSMGSPWKRIFMSLQSDVLTLTILGKERGNIETIMEINVLLCEFKLIGDSICFELQTSQKTHVIQVDTEEELKDWIRTFENAKNHALQTTSQKHGSLDSSSKRKSGNSELFVNNVAISNKEDDENNKIRGMDREKDAETLANSTVSTLESANMNSTIINNSTIDELSLSAPPLDNIMDRANYEFHSIFVNSTSLNEQVQLCKSNCALFALFA